MRVYASLGRKAASLTAVVALVAGAGCGPGEAARSATTVEPRTPSPLVVPGRAPAGLAVAHATIVPTRDSANWGRFVLFGEPDRGDVLDGKVLVAGDFSSSAFGLVREGACERVGEVFRCGVWTVAQRPDPDCLDDCFAFVVGRNTSPEEVEEAADAASFAGNTPRIPSSALPAVDLLVTMPLSLDTLRAPGSQLVEYRRTSDRRLDLVAVDGGRAAADMLRFWIGPDGTMPRLDVWSQPGLHGAVGVDGETVIAAIGTGMPVAALESFVREAERGDAERWDALRSEATAITGAELLGPDTVYGRGYAQILTGRFSSGVWAIGFERDDEGRHVYVEIASTGPDPQDRTGGGGGVSDPGTGERLAVVHNATYASDVGFAGSLVAGVAPAGTARVDVSRGDRTETAVLAPEEAQLGGGRLWAAFLEHRDPGEATVSVVAYSGDGRETGRLRWP